MIIHFTLNGAPQELTVNPGENVQKLLFNMGMHSVRNSDDGFGFAGSDAIIFNGNIVNASLLIAAQLEKADIRTAESLGKWNELSLVQQAMVDVGVVQSGYNDPAAALIITDLLDRIAAPTREEIDDALSGLFSRDAGWQQYYQVIELAVARKNNPQATIDIAPTFRDDLDVIGKHYPKTDAAKMVQAKPCYVEDCVTADACVIKMLRSPHAHALITHLDVSKAEALPGVVHVITHLNCPDIYYTPGGQSAPEPSPLDRRMFGKKMRHVGDRVAAVVAESEEIALEALKLIDVEYEVLKPVMSIDEAMAEDAPVVHDEPVVYVAGAPDTLEDDNSHAAQRGEHMIINFPIGSRPRKNIAASIHGHIGDMDKGFADADVIIERTYNSTQAQQCPTETHICFTRMDGDRLVIHASTQVPWHLRRQVARLVGMKQHKVHVIKERVGGGFGSKQDILLEEVCAWATCVTGRPVLFRYTREEEFIANTSRHVAKVTVKLGAKKDGRLTAVKMDFRANTGPYGNHSLTVPCNGPALSLPLYPCDNVDFQVTTYYSNICPNGAYQGYGAPKGNFAITMALAELAEQLQIDQLEIIERNRVHEGQELKILGAIGEGKAPTSVPSAASCALEEILRQGREMIQWSSPKPQNGDWHIGRGVAIIMQKSGIPDIDQANCMIKLESDGTFIVHSGGADISTGLDTVVTKLAAEVLHCPPQDVHVISGDTDHALFDKGAYASSGTCFSGNAARLAAENLREKILFHGAQMLGEAVADVQLATPGVVRGKKGEVSFGDIAHKGETGIGFGSLVGTGSYITPDFAFPYGANFAEVAVNTRTGEIRLDKFYALLDCGTPVNPELALGQIYGATLRAIGHSMSEEIIYDAEGHPLTRDLRSYGAPKIGDIPRDFRAVLVPSDDKVGPFGAKSISEIGVNGAAPAIATAIHDACGIWAEESQSGHGNGYRCRNNFQHAANAERSLQSVAITRLSPLGI
ncbi:putative hypoxanthine oxidase [Shigella sonnei]|uniref:molybdopterin-dependent oxidoreductase Mo/Fe-S-binding subunit n=1 Tax=Shigella sonnei TaxID=624 RepID=UPI0009730EB0|nr:molybdopterin-dependent oxidoreductase Mo/Fe-S-binding subunit [Shigella sonnei]SJI65544.1 putative hypoxanthine oxidase [Shigella sonnei]